MSFDEGDSTRASLGLVPEHLLNSTLLLFLNVSNHLCVGHLSACIIVCGRVLSTMFVLNRVNLGKLRYYDSHIMIALFLHDIVTSHSSFFFYFLFNSLNCPIFYD